MYFSSAVRNRCPQQNLCPQQPLLASLEYLALLVDPVHEGLLQRVWHPKLLHQKREVRRRELAVEIVRVLEDLAQRDVVNGNVAVRVLESSLHRWAERSNNAQSG